MSMFDVVKMANEKNNFRSSGMKKVRVGNNAERNSNKYLKRSYVKLNSRSNLKQLLSCNGCGSGKVGGNP
jgi:hypothetical protein